MNDNETIIQQRCKQLIGQCMAFNNEQNQYCIVSCKKGSGLTKCETIQKRKPMA